MKEAVTNRLQIHFFFTIQTSGKIHNQKIHDSDSVPAVSFSHGVGWQALPGAVFHPKNGSFPERSPCLK